MRIGWRACAFVLPPPLSLPPQPATNMAAAASVGANHRNVLIALLLTPLQTFAAIDCDRSGRSAVLSSANPRGRGRAARDEHRGKQYLPCLAGAVPKALEQKVGGRRADLAVRDPHRRQRRI